MHGSWHRYRPGERVAPAAGARPARPRGPGRGRGLLRCPGRRALRDARRGAPPVARGARPGPARRRTSTPPRRSAACATRRGPATEIAVALVDQRALAGIGNVYKSEVLWIERVSPFRAVARPRRRDARPARRDRPAPARRQRRRATHGPERVTTAATAARRARSTSTAGPAGRAAAAGRAIRSTQQGDDLPRTTYWCPTCQGARSMTDGRRQCLPTRRRPVACDGRRADARGDGSMTAARSSGGTVGRPGATRSAETFDFLLEREPRECDPLELPDLSRESDATIPDYDDRDRRGDRPRLPPSTTAGIAAPASMRATCASTSSPARPSRSVSTSCGRSPSVSSASGSPGSAGAPPGWRRRPSRARRSYRDVRAFRDDPGRERVGARRDHGRPRPPAPTVAAVDADPAGHAAVRRPGRPLRVQPQRRPARLPGRCGRRTARRAASTAAPTPRSARAGSRMPGSADEPVAPSARRRSTTGSAARRTWRSSPPTARRTTTPGNGENPVFSFRLGRIGVASTGIYSLDRSLFRFVAPAATERRLVGLHRTVSLGRDGTATTPA